MALFLLVLPARAQETPGQDTAAEQTGQQTDQPSSILPVEAAPIAIVTQDAAPVAVNMESGSGDLTINQGDTTIPTDQTPQETDQSKFLSLTLGETLAIMLGSIGLLLGFGKIMWDANQNPGGPSVDERLTARVEAASADQAYIGAMGNAYAAGNAALQKALDSTVQVLQIVAPQTGVKVDDAVLKLLKEIQARALANDAAAATSAPQGYGEAMRRDDLAGSDAAG